MEPKTHYVPYFTQTNPMGQQRAVCGAWVWPHQLRIDPAQLQCWGCRMWMENLHLIEPETAEELRIA